MSPLCAAGQTDAVISPRFARKRQGDAGRAAAVLSVLILAACTSSGSAAGGAPASPTPSPHGASTLPDNSAAAVRRTAPLAVWPTYHLAQLARGAAGMPTQGSLVTHAGVLLLRRVESRLERLTLLCQHLELTP